MGDIGTNEMRIWATVIVCAFVLAMTVAGCQVYDEVVLPQRMADRGYCQQLAEYKHPAGGTAIGPVWRPCQEKAKVE